MFYCGGNAVNQLLFASLLHLQVREVTIISVLTTNCISWINTIVSPEVVQVCLLLYRKECAALRVLARKWFKWWRQFETIERLRKIWSTKTKPHITITWPLSSAKTNVFVSTFFHAAFTQHNFSHDPRKYYCCRLFIFYCVLVKIIQTCVSCQL